MRRGIAVSVFALASVLALAGTSLGISGSVDQSQLDHSWSNLGIGTGGFLAQTFTAGASGTLTGVDVYLQLNGGSATVLTEILGTDGAGLPTGAALASQTGVLVNGWNTVTFTTPTTVTATVKYAIVLGVTTPSSGMVWNGSSTSGAYSGGGPYIFNGPWETLAQWFADEKVDGPATAFAFQTYVLSAAATTTATATETATATATATQCAGLGVVPAGGGGDPTACPTATATATATQCAGLDVVPAGGGGDPTACPTATATATPTATATQCTNISVVNPAAPASTETPCPTAFQSFEGETGTPILTPPPTTTGNGGPSDGSIPLLAMLICLAFGGLGIAAVETQRATIRR